MKRFLSAVLEFFVIILMMAGCAGVPPGGGPFPIVVTIQGTFKTAPVGGPPIQVMATLKNEVPTAGGVKWSLTAAGVACSPACGTLTVDMGLGLTATYMPPADDPSGANLDPTITAASVSAPSESSSFSFALLTKAVSSYIFLLRGFDGVGSPMAMVGNLIIDANNNVRGGEFDLNDGHAIVPVPGPLTGTYVINSAPNATTRGTINLTNVTQPTGMTNLSFKFVLSTDRTNGRIIELDGTQFFTEGTLLLQDPSAVAGMTAPQGPYAFQLDSDDPLGARVVEAGQFGLAAGGAISSGVVDQSQAGAANPTYTAQPLTGSAAAPDALGRGTLVLNVAGNSFDYVYYIVNSSQIDLVGIDNASPTVQSGVARAQSAMNGGGVNLTSILQMTGLNPLNGSPAPDVLIGLAAITGNSLNLLFDSNNAGAVLKKASVSGSVTSFDSTTGRGVLSVTGGFTGGFVDSAVFYLYDPGDGFIIDTDTTSAGGATNYALSGTLTARAAGPFSNSTLSGNAMLAMGGSPTRDVPNAVAGLTFVSAAGTFSGTGSLTSFFKSGGPFVDSSFINATYQVSDATNGYGTATVPASLVGNFTPNSTSPASFYLINTNQAFMIGTNGGSESGVISFIPF
jgi:hypothetical protein